MLYDCWRRLAGRRADETAISDLASGRSWSFAQLATAAETLQPPPGPVVFPQGTNAEFVISVLRGWRANAVVCPLEPAQAAPNIPASVPSQTVHLKTTSATTGAPRLIAFSAEQLKADADNIVATMGLRPEWPNLAIISLAHSYGFSNLVLPLLLYGVPLLLTGSALPETLRRAGQLAPDLTLAAVPALWQTWHDAAAIPPNVRLAISAGAPLPLALEHAVFAKQGLKIHNFYGSSECGGIAYDGTSEPRTDAAFAGEAMKNVEVRIAEGGCIEVRSKAVAESYWPEASASLGSGVFRTSDLGEVVSGRVYLRGRASDQINVAGRKVAPETIEAVLAMHPQVNACLTFGVPSPDTQRGDTIVACIATGPGVAAESIRQYAMEHLPAWQVPREWWFVESLEANGRGKLSRAAWRQRYLQRTQTTKGCGAPF